jgi:hypothetical protein
MDSSPEHLRRCLINEIVTKRNWGFVDLWAKHHTHESTERLKADIKQEWERRKAAHERTRK